MKPIVLLFSCAVLAVASLSAFSADETNAPAARPNRRASPDRPQAGERMGPGFERVMTVLTEEQRASFRRAMEAQRESMRGLEPKLRAARRELSDAGLNGTFDETAVREKALAVATLEAEMTVLRTKALSQIQPPLSPEQIVKLKADEAPGRRGPAERANPAPAPGRDENDLPPKP